MPESKDLYHILVTLHDFNMGILKCIVGPLRSPILFIYFCQIIILWINCVAAVLVDCKIHMIDQKFICEQTVYHVQFMGHS